MPDPYGPTGYGSRYEPSFDAALSRLGLAGPNFATFWREIEIARAAHPWLFSREIPDSNGIRVFRTRDRFPDVPPLLVYYRVEHDPNTIVYLTVSPDWSEDEIYNV